MIENVTSIEVRFEHPTGHHELYICPSGNFSIALYQDYPRYKHLGKPFPTRVVGNLNEIEISGQMVEAQFDGNFGINGSVKPSPEKLTFAQMTALAETLIRNVCDSLTKVQNEVLQPTT